jgi:hypothetical protein
MTSKVAGARLAYEIGCKRHLPSLSSRPRRRNRTCEYAPSKVAACEGDATLVEQPMLILEHKRRRPGNASRSCNSDLPQTGTSR